jgi:hypothetical protein
MQSPNISGMEQPKALRRVNDVKIWSASAQPPQPGDLWKILVKPLVRVIIP